MLQFYVFMISSSSQKWNVGHRLQLIKLEQHIQLDVNKNGQKSFVFFL